MKKLLCALGLIALWFVGLAPLAMSQDEKAPVELWEIDRDGLRQWIKFEAECEPCVGTGESACKQCEIVARKDCAECRGKSEAKCRDCGGSGEQYDPLAEMVCPFCDGSALWACGGCEGKGTFGIVGGGKKEQRCGPCKATGALTCEVCGGKRRISILKAGGGSPRKASESAIAKAREALTDSIASLKSFDPTSRESDDFETFEVAVKGTSKNLPVFKNVKKMLKSGLKALRDQANFVGYEEWVIREFNRIRLRSIRMMEEQLKVLDLCDERLEFNAKVRAGE